LAHIVVDYEPVAPVLDPLEALREDAPRVHAPAPNVYVHRLIRRGAVERAMASADRVFERRYSTQMVEHVSLEPHAAIAQWDDNGRLTIYATVGRISLARADIARVLALPMHRIRVIGTVGGNFGGKNEITHEPVLALLAKKAGRPVKGVFSRAEEFTATTTRHPIVMDYRTGVRRDGRILAREVRLVLDGGAYCSWSETTLAKACILSPGPYRIDHLRAEAFAVYTNKTMTGAMRGFGAPQVCFAYESQMDEIADALGIDPLAIRLMNGFEEGSTSPTGQTLRSVALNASLRAAAERFGWSRERT
jgi:CO/xanthine dehydrogenase Mo-binding subunit